MTARILLRPPQRSSNGCRQLRQALPESVSRFSRCSILPRQYHLAINWGNSSPLQALPRQKVLNPPDKVANAIDKLRAFNLWKERGIAIPFYSDSKCDVDLDNHVYLARLHTTGSGGEGIVVLRKGDEVPEAPLYVRYIPKREEYRVHVFCGSAIHVQQKRRRSGVEQSADEKLIRNYDNGWVFCNVDLTQVDPSLLELAVKACAALGLDFGALDMVKSNHDGEYYVLECNTAPGLDSPTAIQKYTSAILKEYERGRGAG